MFFLAMISHTHHEKYTYVSTQGMVQTAGNVFHTMLFWAALVCCTLLKMQPHRVQGTVTGSWWMFTECSIDEAGSYVNRREIMVR